MKRARGSGGLSAQQKGQIAGYRFNKLQPYSTYGAARVRRGSEWSLGNFGTSYKAATPAQRAARKSTGYTGLGDYMSDYRSSGGSLLRGLGGHAGSMLGSEKIGRSIGGMASRMVGFGDYHAAQANQIVGGGAGGNVVPLSVNSGKDLSGDVYMNHREFIGNVVASATGAGTSTFSNTAYPINVGLSAVFPFLSQIAQNFTMYELEGLIYEYVPTSGEFGSSASNQLGKVVMATNYDPDAPVFTNSVQMENYDYANSSKPSCAMVHGVETKMSQRVTNMMYVRTGPISKDPVFTDIGTFQIATEGISFAAAGVAVVGELWVTYRVKLSRANVNLTIGAQNASNFPFQSFNSGNTLNNAASSTGVCMFTPNVAANALAFSNSFLFSNIIIAGSTSGDTATSALSSAYNSGNGGWINYFLAAGGSNVQYFAFRFPDNVVSGTYKLLIETFSTSRAVSFEQAPIFTKSANVTQVGQSYFTTNPALATESVAEICTIIVKINSSASTAGISGVGQTGTYVIIQPAIGGQYGLGPSTIQLQLTCLQLNPNYVNGPNGVGV